jgi:hypothetical protein
MTARVRFCSCRTLNSHGAIALCPLSSCSVSHGRGVIIVDDVSDDSQSSSSSPPTAQLWLDRRDARQVVDIIV